jgi:hypothetical protein
VVKSLLLSLPSFFLSYLPSFLSVVLGVKPRAWCILGKCSSQRAKLLTNRLLKKPNYRYGGSVFNPSTWEAKAGKLEI